MPDRHAEEQRIGREREAISGNDPHADLSNPARDPDPTEHPDPYDRREDPRDPAKVDTPADPADQDETGPDDVETPRAPSTSDPRGPQSHDREHYEGSER